MSAAPIRVLVTGVGSTTAQSIIKSLRSSALPIEIFGTDMDPLSPGLYRVDRAYLVKRFTDAGYEAQLLDLLRENRIQALFPALDAELDYVSERKPSWEAQTGCRVLVNPPRVLSVAQDKFATVKFLEAHGCSAPKSTVSLGSGSIERFVEDCGFPLIVKPRRGSTSKDIYLVRTMAELLYRVAQVRNPIVQEYLDSEEYTCGTVVDADGDLKGVAVLQRRIVSGATMTAIADDFEDVADEVRRIATALRPEAPVNIQLRRNRDGRPTAFEINGRFSGAGAIRAHFGFNEAEATIRSFVLGERIDPLRMRPGAAMRYLNEVYAEAGEVEALIQAGGNSPRSAVECHF